MKKFSLLSMLILLVSISCKETSKEEMATPPDTENIERAEAAEEVVEDGGRRAAAMNFTFNDLPQKLKETYRANNSEAIAVNEVPINNILRIEEKIPVRWSGVKSCGDQDRINRNVKKAVESWVSKKMFEHSDRALLKWGAPSADVRVSSSKAPWPDNSRSCRGSVTLSCFIEFYNP